MVQRLGSCCICIERLTHSKLSVKVLKDLISHLGFCHGKKYPRDEVIWPTCVLNGCKVNEN